MAKESGIKDAGKSFRDTLSTGLAGAKTVFGKIGAFIHAVGVFLFCLRKPVMTIPVVYAALKIARVGLEYLPDRVRLELLPSEIFVNLSQDGAYILEMAKEQFLYGSLALTGICLVLMWCSRKTVYPWIISIFTLILPLVVLISNIYPM